MNSERWFILGALVLARTVMGFQFQSVVGVSPFLRADLALGLAELGILVGAYMLPGIVVALPGGTLGDRFGQKRIAIVGLLLMAAGGAVTALAGDFATATLGRVISGAGAVVLNVLLTGMVAEWFAGGRLVTAMGLLVTSWPLGIGLALVTGPWIAAALGWPAMIWLSVAASLAACGLIAAVYRRPDTVAGAAPAAHATPGALTARDFWAATWSGQVWALYNVGYIIVISFMPALMLAGGTPPATAGVVTSLATWILILTIPVGSLLIDRVGHTTAIMQLCFAAMAVAMAATAVVPAALAIVVIVGIFAGPPAGAIMALPAGALSAAARSTGMGIYFTWYYVAMAALPPFAGWLGDTTGATATPLVFGAIVMAAAMLSLQIFRRHAAHPKPGDAKA